MKLGYVAGSGDDWPDLIEMCRHVEATGWDGIWLSDHLMPPTVWFPEPTAFEALPWNEGWTALAALAASVPRVRLGHIVTSNLLRPPALLAKMAATVDRISGGRLVLGLGAGYYEREHEAYGIPFPEGGERLRRLEEACIVVRRLFDQPRATYEGRFFRLRNAPLAPKPVQKRLPLLLAGTGEKVLLRIVARHADIWNMPGRPEAFEPKLRALDRHCRDAARNPGEIERTAIVIVRFSDGPPADFPWPEDWMVTGTVIEIRQTLRRFADLGVTTVLTGDAGMGTTIAERKAGLDRLLCDVVGQLGSARVP